MSDDEAPRKVDGFAQDRHSISSKTSKIQSIVMIFSDIDSDFINEHRRRVTSGETDNVVLVSGSRRLDEGLLALLMKSDKTAPSINNDDPRPPIERPRLTERPRSESIPSETSGSQICNADEPGVGAKTYYIHKK